MTNEYFGVIIVKDYGFIKIIDKDTFQIAKTFLKMMENKVMKEKEKEK